MEKMTPVSILRKFFGLKPGQTLQDFLAELKTLSPDERKELAELAAKVLGVEVDYSTK